MTCSLMAPVAGGGFWRAGDYKMLDAADPDRCFSDLMQHPVLADLQPITANERSVVPDGP